MNSPKTTTGPVALIPFLVFIFTFLGIGFYLEDFYAFPSPLAVVIAIATALIIFRGKLSEKINTLLEGCGDSKILTMCLIYLLAGAFATVSGAMGGVDSVVNLGLSFIAPEIIPAGIFIIAAFLSTATGTSVGSIVALGPIVIALADSSGNSLALMSATLLGGAMFGDNLSIISDTTIAATQSLGVKMKDKFKINIFIALPAAIITVLLLVYIGFEAHTEQGVAIEAGDYSLVKIIPYLLVIILAVLGVNVFVVLFLGILLAGAIGLIDNSFNLLQFTNVAYDGFLGMTDIFLLSLLTGGLAALVSKAGGIDYLLEKIHGRIKNRKSAQMGIFSLVGLTNFAIANNTVSIIITGPVAKNISEDYELDKRKSAALIDISACLVQGLLPYGAQILLLLSFAGGRLSFPEIIFNAWYLLLLLVFAVLAIYWTPVDRLIKRWL